MLKGTNNSGVHRKRDLVQKKGHDAPYSCKMKWRMSGIFKERLTSMP